MRSFSVIGLAAVLALFAVEPAAAQSSSGDASTVVQQLVAAFSRDDRSAAIGMFTDDAVVIGGPCGGPPANGECVGRAMIDQAVRGGDPVQVGVYDLQVVGDGNTVTFRTQEQFQLPPQAIAAGVHRMVELGTAVIVDGKVDRLALVPDVTDPQTVTLQHVFASLGPPPAAQSGGTTASDGQSLASQSAATQAAFKAAYGDQAAQAWTTQHQAGLSH